MHSRSSPVESFWWWFFLLYVWCRTISYSPQQSIRGDFLLLLLLSISLRLFLHTFDGGSPSWHTSLTSLQTLHFLGSVPISFNPCSLFLVLGKMMFINFLYSAASYSYNNKSYPYVILLFKHISHSSIVSFVYLADFICNSISSDSRLISYSIFLIDSFRL